MSSLVRAPEAVVIKSPGRSSLVPMERLMVTHSRLVVPPNQDLAFSAAVDWNRLCGMKRDIAIPCPGMIPSLRLAVPDLLLERTSITTIRLTRIHQRE